MRIDQVVHWLCLLKSRSLATRGCRERRILLNGQPVRPAHDVQAGDEITMINPRGDRRRVVRILQVPQRQQSRQDAGALYTLVREEHIDPRDDTVIHRDE